MKHIKSAIPFIIFTLLSILLYYKVLNAPFILDDEMYIANNYKIKNLSTFITDLSGTRYIGFLTFALNYYFNGLNTYGYHIVNILIHILNTSLVYLLIKITLNRLKDIDSRLKTQDTRLKFEVLSLESGVLGLYYLPFACSLIFLIHPIQTQAVSYITQRFTSLATFFYLLAIVLYVKARTNEHRAEGIGHRVKSLRPMPYALCIFSAILAMKTKEISFTLPFIILLYEITFLSHSSSRTTDHASRTTAFLYLIPFFLTLIIIPLSLFGSDLPIEGNGADKELREYQLRDIRNMSTYTYLLTQFRVIITYIRLMIIPINQHFEYDFPLSNSIFEPETLISFLVLLSIFSFAVYLFIRSRRTNNTHGLLISFGLLWFFITLSVESSIIPIKDVIFEHRLYLPSIGFILSITIAIFYGLKTLDSRLKVKVFSLVSIVLCLFFIIIAIFSFATYKRTILWGDRLLLYLDEVNKSPNKPSLHNNIGIIYFKKGLVDKAMEHCQIALKLNPDFPEAHNNLGNIYSDKGLIDTAIEHYQTALRLKPDYSETHYNLGNAYQIKGLLDKAIEHYQIALRLKPNFNEAYYNMDSAYQIKGLLDKTMEHYLIALKLDPDNPEAHNNIGTAYVFKGWLDKAVEHFQIAVRLRPNYSEAYYNMGNIYYDRGLIDKAMEYYNIAIKLKPNFPEVHNNLGIVYYDKGFIDKAVEHFEIALKLKPNYPEAQDNLKRILKESNIPPPFSP